MRGPSVAQFEEESSSPTPRGVSKKNQQWDSVRTKLNSPKGETIARPVATPGPGGAAASAREKAFSSAATPTTTNVKTALPDTPPGAGKPEPNPNEGEEQSGEWICEKCLLKGLTVKLGADEEFCGTCATWRRVMTTRGTRGGNEERQVVTTNDAWGATFRASNGSSLARNSRDHANVGAVRHEQSRLRKAKSTGERARGGSGGGSASTPTHSHSDLVGRAGFGQPGSKSARVVSHKRYG
jgi:hypothetical protein